MNREKLLITVIFLLVVSNILSLFLFFSAKQKQAELCVKYCKDMGYEGYYADFFQCECIGQRKSLMEINPELVELICNISR